MKLPTLNTLETSREMTAEFRGYNHNHSIGGGEFYDMKNLTSSYYPLLSPRGKRGTYRFEDEVVDDEGNIIERPTNVQGIIAKDNLCFVADGKFYINGKKVEGTQGDPFFLASEGKKHLVSMGAYVVIFPDKKYINTLEPSDYGSLENVQESKGSPVAFTIADKDGSVIKPQTTKPPEPQNGDLWLDTSVKPNALKRWNESTGMWVQMATTYVRIDCTGIGVGFKDGDGVFISGLKDVQLVEATNGGNISDDGISAIDGAFVIQKCTDDYIIVIGIIDEAVELSNNITIERRVPDMDFVVESENRLWGCKYGPVYKEKDGVKTFEKNVNELYACKLGDFKNWNCFERISTDSYVASLGSDGVFTGAITHLGYPLFFKEDCVHKVYGNYPANFQIQTIACRGVQAGCSESLAIVNEVLYYKSKSGVCAYDGSLPVEISAEFGEERYGRTNVDERQNGVKVAFGGSHGNKYYISMRHDMTGEYHLFVYDAAKGMWHKEDNTKAEGFCFCNGELYYIEGGEIRTMFGDGVPDTEPIEWMAETGVIGVYSPDKKYLSRLNVSLSLDVGTRVQFYVQYDSMGDYEHVCSLAGLELRSFAVPIKPKRCNHMRLRIVGVGDAKIYNITKTIEQGSDI